MVKYVAGRKRRRDWRMLSWGAAVAALLVASLGLSLHLLMARSKPAPVVAADGKAVYGVKTVANPPKKQPKHADLPLSVDPALRKLAEYETIYEGAVANELMVFAGLPADTTTAAGDADDMATKLKEFQRYHIQPLIVMEPTVNGKAVSIADFAAGKYDAVLADYFKGLKERGVTDSMMGTWVHFPEYNIPEWGNTDPQTFQTVLMRAVRLQRSAFPASKVSLLLNGQTFQSNDVERNYGKFVSLLPYVRGLPKGTFDSFGLQGFPWVSPANEQEQNKLLSPAQYLNANFAREAAKELGTTHIWFNTGTFSRMYADDPAKTVTYTPAQRQNILQVVLAQVHAAQRGGYKVSVNMFSYDGSATGEATDWSYWHSGQTAAEAPGQIVFKAFAEQLYGNGSELWLFDSD